MPRVAIESVEAVYGGNVVAKERVYLQGGETVARRRTVVMVRRVVEFSCKQ